MARHGSRHGLPLHTLGCHGNIVMVRRASGIALPWDAKARHGILFHFMSTHEFSRGFTARYSLACLGKRHGNDKLCHGIAMAFAWCRHDIVNGSHGVPLMTMFSSVTRNERSASQSYPSSSWYCCTT